MPRTTQTTTGDPRPATRRALGLDALRGLAIVLVCLASVVPGGLPNAMYPGDAPRFLPDAEGGWSPITEPGLDTANWVGFSWGDWVFPVLLFAMGAAIPLAQSKRIAQGRTRLGLTRRVVWRWLTLIGLSVYVYQVAPRSIHASTDDRGLLLALVGFALLFPVLTRLPGHWHSRAALAVRLAGGALCVGFVAYLNTGAGKSFSWQQHDRYLLILAHSLLFAGVAWLLVPKRSVLRLVLLLPVMFVAHHQSVPSEVRLLGGTLDGLDRLWNLPRAALDLSAWVPGGSRLNAQGFDLSPLWDFTALRFLWLVVPGTIAGDLLVKAMTDERKPKQLKPAPPWGARRHTALVVLLLATIGLVFWGANDYGQVLFTVFGYPLHTPYAGLILGGLPLAAAGLLVHRPGSRDDQLITGLYGWGTAVLLVGLVLAVAPQVRVGTGLTLGFDPWHFSSAFDAKAVSVAWDRDAFFEQGMRSGMVTSLSYYLVSLGLAVLALIVLTLVVDRSRAGRWLLGFLVLAGQNTLLAYVGASNLLAPLMKLPFAVAFGLGGCRSFDELGYRWMPEQLAQWRGRPRLAGEPWVLLVWSAVKTLLLAWFTAVAALCRVVWRS